MKKYLMLAAALALAAALSGCAFIESIESFIGRSSESQSEHSESETSSAEESSEPEDSEWPVTIEGVSIPEQPQSVAVLSPSL